MGMYAGNYVRFASAVTAQDLLGPLTILANAITMKTPHHYALPDFDKVRVIWPNGYVRIGVVGDNGVYYLEAIIGTTLYRWSNCGPTSEWVVGKRHEGIFSWEDSPRGMISTAAFLERAIARILGTNSEPRQFAATTLTEARAEALRMAQEIATRIPHATTDSTDPHVTRVSFGNIVVTLHIEEIAAALGRLTIHVAHLEMPVLHYCWSGLTIDADWYDLFSAQSISGKDLLAALQEWAGL